MPLHRYANPDDFTTILKVVKNKDPETPYTKEDILHDVSEKFGYTLKDTTSLESRILLGDLGLINKNNSITDKGTFFYNYLINRPHIFYDLIHGLQVTYWNGDQEKTGFSWTYKSICSLLWYSGKIKKIDTKHILAQLSSQAIESFKENPALSTKSVDGVLIWLNMLNPPIKSEEYQFELRKFCYPELLALVIDSIYREKGLSYGSQLLLEPEIRQNICKMCLIEEQSLFQVFNFIKRNKIFEEDLVIGENRTTWGSTLTLNKKLI